MDISKEVSHLLSQTGRLRDLSEDGLNTLWNGTNTQYLDLVSTLSLDPSYTSLILSAHQTISVEICARWVFGTSHQSNSVAIFAALARILSIQPHLSVYIKELLAQKQNEFLLALKSPNAMALLEVPHNVLQEILLALYRLLLVDNEAFALLVAPAQVQPLLGHAFRPIRYLAIRVLCLYLHTSDACLEQMIDRYLGKQEVEGEWEGINIDYIFLSLWEEKRIKKLTQDFQDSLEACQTNRFEVVARRIIGEEDFSETTVCLAGVLLPCLGQPSATVSPLAMTQTTRANMEMLARALNQSRPLLVSGPLGEGKTSLVREAARSLGVISSLVTLHLNEQTDAKLLIGMYTSVIRPGSFTWQPGVLTRAVLEGRWVLIEDLNRAPMEVISIILPLLERGELLVSHWGETIRAAPGFKIIATFRSNLDGRDEQLLQRRISVSLRHWIRIPLQILPDDELAEVVLHRFPTLHAYISRVLSVFISLRERYSASRTSESLDPYVGKPFGIRDLLRWCTRLNGLLQRAGVRSGNESIPESVNDGIFLEAVDCFANHLPECGYKEDIIKAIAQHLYMSQERAAFCLKIRKPGFSRSEAVVRIGRITISTQPPHNSRSKVQKKVTNPFAITNHVRRNLESVGVAVKMAEPCLLIGETGTGKTALVQQLAEMLNHKLIVVNLSQQSEAGDLLGGFKPANLTSLALSLKDEFDDLFDRSFPSRKNQRYVEHVGKAISKRRWFRVLTLWQEAVRTAESFLSSNIEPSPQDSTKPLTKKRKLNSLSIQTLKSRWDCFAAEVRVFEKHIGSGPKGFAFSFVEGNIVQAARNGDWVLLDEINLASPDTLESLADLLVDRNDESPSLLLTETGDPQRIRVHDGFRIFGAMNPATDVGKRDLPPSLRSRFTEVYIDSPDKHLEDLVPLVEAYLGTYAHSDARAANDIAQLYLEVQRLAYSNQLVDGINQKPHFSLRTLTRTLTYVCDVAPIYGLRRALFEGFSMSFMTLLNLTSNALLIPLIDRFLLSGQGNSRSLLFQIPKSPQDPKLYVRYKHYWLAQGSEPVNAQPNYIITPFVDKNLVNLVRASSNRKFPILLQGPTSSGKTSMIEYLANISGNKFVRINNHEHTDLQEYLGTYISDMDGQLQYRDGVLVQALREGHWIVLDELNLAPADVLEALNRLLDDNRELLVPETQQIVRPHNNFMLFATQNPPGIYGGRKVLSRAFRNRFLELHFDEIPEDELETILRERSRIAPSFCTRIVAVYKKLSLLRQHSRLFEQKNSFATLRDLFRWALRDADNREELATNGFLLLAERVRNAEERLVVKRTIEEVMKVKLDEDHIYGLDRLRSDLKAYGSGYHAIVWTKSMRRLYVLLVEALKNREPVLLVGDTGSGKTTVCQVIAKIMGKELHIVNAHQNMETGDLIGSQRPVRSRALAEAQLTKDLFTVFNDHLKLDISQQSILSQLLSIYANLSKKEIEKIPPEMTQSLRRRISEVKDLFQWADGSIVHAMRTGDHFLLDEISLADDSVLERLNSVLEPSRTLHLAEKGTDDSLVVAAPQFQFLATMNPGGDFGKRELSPALRNRFTEVWVPSLSDAKEIEEILLDKLGKKYAKYAQPMIEFASWYGTVFYKAGPIISIRELLAWSSFLETCSLTDPHSALAHGAAMTYIDAIGAHRASQGPLVHQTMAEQRRACQAKFFEIFGFKSMSSYGENLRLTVTDRELTAGPFILQKSQNVSLKPQYSLEAPTTMRNVIKIARALQLPRPILLEGDPGVGKTSLVTALAHVVGIPLTRINLSDQTDLMDLFGMDTPVEGAEVGQFKWQDGPFLRAMQHGEWVLLDEMNLAPQAILEGLNACFDHRGQVYISELGQTFTRHPKFVVFAAQNPHYQGSGRKGLPASFLSRFTVVYADTLNLEDLLIISKESFPTAANDHIRALTKCVTDLSGKLERGHLVEASDTSLEFNLRDIMRSLEVLTSRDGLLTATNLLDCYGILFLQRLRKPVDIVSVTRLLGIHPQEYRDLFRGMSANHVQVGVSLLPRRNSPRMSSKMLNSIPLNLLPFLQSLMLSVQKKWPCVLVGPSGSGKTILIQQLARCVGADLIEFPMNADLDTMDLVGGYEQVDDQRIYVGFVNHLRSLVHAKISQGVLLSSIGDQNLARLETFLRSCSSSIELQKIIRLVHDLADKEDYSSLKAYVREYEISLDEDKQDNRARFEWIDGILIKALVEGKWLVLDNANLCSPSVLDRLNSLLEPNGVLHVNEQRSADGFARIVRPHPDFRLFLTMDPRHGELSRAMRNRALELFLPFPNDSNRPTFDLTLESKMARFKQFEYFDWKALDVSVFDELLSVVLGYCAFADVLLLQRWYKQISRGLLDVGQEKLALFSSQFELFAKLLSSPVKPLQRIMEAYHKFAKELDLPGGFAESQVSLLDLETEKTDSN